MEGIPVYPNGDPVTRTLVFAGNYSQFSNWCMYSRVNRRSRMVKYIMGEQDLHGYHGVDLVFTGLCHTRRDYAIELGVVRYLNLSGAILTEYGQYESADIIPNVVEAPVEPRP